MRFTAGKTILELMTGDITAVNGDAIVNAANNSLLGGGGVDGAVHLKAGPELLKECRTLGGCPTGEARITNAYNLPVRYIIHTVGPVYSNGQKGEDKLLSLAYLSSLILAEKYKVKVLSFPSISTGVYGYPMDKAAKICLSVIKGFLEKGSSLELIRIVLFKDDYLQIFRKEACNNFKVLKKPE